MQPPVEGTGNVEVRIGGLTHYWQANAFWRPRILPSTPKRVGLPMVCKTSDMYLNIPLILVGLFLF